MERISQIHPDEHAAIQRLLLAVALSLLLHAIIVWFVAGGVSASDAPALQAQLLPPRVAGFSASLQAHAAAVDAQPTVASSSSRRVSTISGLDTPDPRYYPVEELDFLPFPRQPIKFSEALPVTGRIRLLARIDASGRLTRVSVFDSEATDIQNAAAVDALHRSVFSAARKDGRLVRSEVVIELAAHPDN